MKVLVINSFPVTVKIVVAKIILPRINLFFLHTEKFFCYFFKKPLANQKQVVVEILQAHILSLNTNLKTFNINSQKEKPCFHFLLKQILR